MTKTNNVVNLSPPLTLRNLTLTYMSEKGLWDELYATPNILEGLEKAPRVNLKERPNGNRLDISEELLETTGFDWEVSPRNTKHNTGQIISRCSVRSHGHYPLSGISGPLLPFDAGELSILFWRDHSTSRITALYHDEYFNPYLTKIK